MPWTNVDTGVQELITAMLHYIALHDNNETIKNDEQLISTIAKAKILHNTYNYPEHTLQSLLDICKNFINKTSHIVDNEKCMHCGKYWVSGDTDNGCYDDLARSYLTRCRYCGWCAIHDVKH